MAPGALTVPHVPSAAPPALAHAPPQHSKSPAQTSPACTQKDGLPQTPPLQVFEQHSPPAAHGLPDVLHDGFRGAHMPPPTPSGAHRPPQHSASVPHAALSATHWRVAQVPERHEKVQHSVPAAHAAPGALHAVIGAVHFFEVGSQFAVQQSRLVAQS